MLRVAKKYIIIFFFHHILARSVFCGQCSQMLASNQATKKSAVERWVKFSLLPREWRREVWVVREGWQCADVHCAVVLEWDVDGHGARLPAWDAELV